MTRLLNSICLIGIVCSLLASIPIWARSSDRHQLAHLRADSAKYDRLHNLSVFTGNVHFTQGTTSVTAQKIIAISDSKTHKLIKIVASGNPATYSTQPDGKKFYLHAKARIIKYLPTKSLAKLIGNGVITAQLNSFRGPYIVYNMKQQTIVSKPRNHQQTRIVIQP